MGQRQSIAYLIDPRFPGGTSSAVAHELRVVSAVADVTVHAVSSSMFSGTEIAPQLKRTLLELGVDPVWDQPTISADTVIIHNPSFLKFQKSWKVKIVTRELIVVTHENFLRPLRTAAFDVATCLGLIDRASLALRKIIAPVSPYNRSTILEWFGGATTKPWSLLETDWFNICDFPMRSPSARPEDRRGRHSRPGYEKFPSLADMDLCFPDHAVVNVILGADTFLNQDARRPHWQLHPFRAIEVADFFDMIDFMVYFTAPTWRESFGRVLAEAIAAGKVVISDAGTAATFGDAVIVAQPADVDAVIGKFLSDPALYRDHVRMAQAHLASFSGDAFRQMLQKIRETTLGSAV